MSRRLIEKAEELLKKEKGAVYKDPGVGINICLVYPNTYGLGMSNLGFQGVYRLLNEKPDVVCERAFLPDEGDMEEYERSGTQLFALESGRPLGKFDIVAFSISFENDYPNVLKILELARIPAKGRGNKDPLVVAGGVCAFANPEPLADFIDLFFVGEAEALVDGFLGVCRRAGNKEELLSGCSREEGLYVPSLYEVAYKGTQIIRRAIGDVPDVVRRRYSPEIPAGSPIVTPEMEFSGMRLIEVMRGCPWSCGFCLAGHVYNPPRKKALDAVKQEIEEAKKGGFRVGLVGPSLTDYPYAQEVLRVEGVDFSITSLRASPKSAGLISLMKNARSVSIAPEAGTERLRRVINKRITEEDILESASLILSEGARRLRLYYMVGLPTETDEDIQGIVELTRKIRGLSSKGEIVLTLSTFVPKPFTPFEWHPMERRAVVKARMQAVKKTLGKEKGIGVFHDVPKYSYMQGLFSMGDRRVSGVLEEMLAMPDWQKAALKRGVDPDYYIFRKKHISESLPWDFIDSGIQREELWERYLKAIGDA